MRNDWLCGRIQALHRNLARIIPWQLTEREESGERRAGLDSQVGCIVSPSKDLHPQPKTTVGLLQFGQWLSAFEFLIYKLNECSIPFTRERLSDEGTHFIACIC